MSQPGPIREDKLVFVGIHGDNCIMCVFAVPNNVFFYFFVLFFQFSD
jgi:hypothetical protein